MAKLRVRHLGLFLLLLAFDITQATALQHEDASGRPSSGVPKRMKLDGTVSVPLIMQQPGNRPSVEIMINGKGPYNFLVETGSHTMDISAQLAAKLGLTRRQGSEMSEASFHLDSVKLGDAVFEDLTIYELPSLGSLEVQGVLGLAFFHDVLLTVDYPQQSLRVERGALPAANGKDVLPLSRVSGFWGLPISMNGKDFTAVLDTQNSGSLNIPPDVAGQLMLTDLKVVGKARGAFGEADVKRGKLEGDLVVGVCKFPQALLGVVQLPPEYPNRPNLGSGILKNFVVTLDQVNARLRLAHAEPCVIETPAAPTHAAPATGS